MLGDVLSDDYLRTSVDDNHWICKTCDAALSRGRMPVQAKANGLRLGTVPSELSCLKPLEMRLISLRVPFMKMVALPSGKQRCIHGPAVNVPSKLDSICTMLPRLPSQSELIPLKLKRKLAYKGHYMYDYVTPENVLNALRWLKAHNPLYANVEINEEWAQNAESNDTDLYAGLVNRTVRIDSSDTESEPMQVDDSARLSEDTVDNSNSMIECDTTSSSQLSNEVSCESWPVNLVPALNNLRAFATDKNFSIHDVPRDGNCLFSAVLYQLVTCGLFSSAVEHLRQLVASYLEDHNDFYVNFVHDPVLSEDPYNADNEHPNEEDVYIASMSDPTIRSRLRWEKYLGRLRNDAWGDQLVIAALSNMFNVTINVSHATEQACTVTTNTPTDNASNIEMNIGAVPLCWP